MRSFSLKERLKCVVGLWVVLICFSRFYRALLVQSTSVWTHESALDTAVLWVGGNPPARRSLEEEGILYEDRSQHCLGQEQESFGDNFDKNQSLVGDIGDVNLWDCVVTSWGYGFVMVGLLVLTF